MAGNQNSGQHFKTKPDGSGRPIGGKNQKTKILEELMSHSYWADKVNDNTIMTPALFWFEILEDKTQPIEIRHEVAKSLAPYLYQKLPVLTETTVKTEQVNTDGFTISEITK